MSELKHRIAALQTRAAEVALTASLATDPDARAHNERLLHELESAIAQLQAGAADRAFLLEQAAKARKLALETAEPQLRDELEGLAAELERDAQQSAA
jgi:hypothetical protein